MGTFFVSSKLSATLLLKLSCREQHAYLLFAWLWLTSTFFDKAVVQFSFKILKGKEVLKTD